MVLAPGADKAIASTGIRFIEVEHADCSQSREAEADRLNQTEPIGISCQRWIDRDGREVFRPYIRHAALLDRSHLNLNSLCKCSLTIFSLALTRARAALRSHTADSFFAFAEPRRPDRAAAERSRPRRRTSTQPRCRATPSPPHAARAPNPPHSPRSCARSRLCLQLG